MKDIIEIRAKSIELAIKYYENSAIMRPIQEILETSEKIEDHILKATQKNS